MDGLDFEELIWYLMNSEDEDVFDRFEEKYHMTMEDARKLVKDLLPLCQVGQSPLTDKYYRGFATGDTWLIKQEIILKRDGS